MAVRAMLLTAVAARKGLGFFFFGTGRDLTTKDTKEDKGFQKSRAEQGIAIAVKLLRQIEYNGLHRLEHSKAAGDRWVILKSIAAIWIPRSARDFRNSYARPSQIVLLRVLCGYYVTNGRARLF